MNLIDKDELVFLLDQKRGTMDEMTTDPEYLEGFDDAYDIIWDADPGKVTERMLKEHDLKTYQIGIEAHARTLNEWRWLMLNRPGMYIPGAVRKYILQIINQGYDIDAVEMCIFEHKELFDERNVRTWSQKSPEAK